MISRNKHENADLPVISAHRPRNLTDLTGDSILLIASIRQPLTRQLVSDKDAASSDALHIGEQSEWSEIQISRQFSTTKLKFPRLFFCMRELRQLRRA